MFSLASHDLIMSRSMSDISTYQKCVAETVQRFGGSRPRKIIKSR